MKKVDILVKRVRVIDGLGNKEYIANVAINDQKIDYIGEDSCIVADTIINGEGLVLAPGFIDPHGHTDMDFMGNDHFHNKIEQGVTTEFAGLCGLTSAPVSEKYFLELKNYFGIDDPNCIGNNFITNWSSYKTFKSYLSAVEKLPLSCNTGFYVGQGTVRLAVMGFENRNATELEMEKMKDYVREAMENGAVGLSTGLIYPPGLFTPRYEIEELCKVIKDYDGIYSTHMRNESDRVVDCVKESIDIGRKTGVKVAISHLKVFGRKNWGRSDEILEIIEQAIAEGINVSFDFYPYNAAGTYLDTAIPPAYHVGGKEKLLERLEDTALREEIKEEILHPKTYWENMVKNCGFDGMLVTKYATPESERKTLAEYAATMGMDPVDALYDILIKTRCKALVALFGMSDDDVKNLIKCPWGMVCTDGAMTFGHPRSVGTYPRILGRYVREKKLVSLTEAVRRITSLPATHMGLKNKGIIKEGYDADIVIFNPATIIDNADFSEPYAKNDGIEYVLVNGRISVKGNVATGETNGKVLRF